MIIFDMSNIFFINLHASMEGVKREDKNFDANTVRYMTLNMIRAVTSRYKGKYGEVVFACDAMKLWRKDVFKPYKAHRKKDREALEYLDWKEVFDFFGDFKKELTTYTKYKVIEVTGAEGDDIISTLAIQYDTQPNLIVSTDKDFKQLQVYTKCDQYNPVTNKIMKATDPFKYLQEHIITGDRGDGVPNILSDDDIFLQEGVRQGKITEKRLDFFKTVSVSDWSSEIGLTVYCSKCNIKDKNKEAARELLLKAQKNFFRNKTLIDLREVPDDIQEAIIDKYKEVVKMGPRSLFDYFYKYNLTQLMGSISDF